VYFVQLASGTDVGRSVNKDIGLAEVVTAKEMNTTKLVKKMLSEYMLKKLEELNFVLHVKSL
jgi:hypothetical protein